MTATAPDWLAKRGGSLQVGLRQYITHVLLAGQPQYRLEVRPAMGSFECVVTQSVNGKRLDAGAAHPTAESALAGGLAELREKLGW